MKSCTPILPLLLVASCSLPGFGTSPKLTKRYRSHKHAKKDHIVSVQITATKPAPPTAPAPAVLQLSDHGQAAFVASSPYEEGKLVEELSKPFHSPQPSSTSRTRIRSTVILTHAIDRSKKLTRELAHLDPRPPSDADRIASLEITLEPIGPVSFDGFNRFETVYGEVALGELTRSSSRTFNANLKPTLSGTVIGTGDVGSTAESGIEEKVVLRDRIIQISGFLLKKEGRIILEGGVGIDLEGNTSVDLVLELDGGEVPMIKIASYTNKQGGALEGHEIAPSFVMTKIPVRQAEKGIGISVTSKYRFRHVKMGIETVTESDDRVVEYSGSTEKDSTIVVSEQSHDDLSHYYQIRGNDKTLSLRRGIEESDLNFGTKPEASAFIRWLQKQDDSALYSIGMGHDAWQLTLGDEALQATDRTDLKTAQLELEDSEKDAGGDQKSGIDNEKGGERINESVPAF